MSDKQLLNEFLEEARDVLRADTPCEESLKGKVQTLFERFFAQNVGNEIRADLLQMSLNELQKEKAERIAENRFHKQLLDAVDTGIRVISPDFKIRYVNKYYADLHGLKPKDIIGKSCYDYLSSDNCNSTDCSVRQILNGAESLEIDINIETNSKTRAFILSVIPLKENSEQTNGIIETYKDISRRNENQKIIKEQKTRLELAFTNAKQSLWDWHIASGKFFLNKSAHRILGYNSEKFINNAGGWLKLIHPDDRQNALKALKDHFRGKTPHFEAVHRLKKADDTYIWVINKGKITEHSPDNKATRAIGIYTDISAQKQTEIALREANESKDKFFSIIAHDLRNPFNALMGFSELLVNKSQALSPERQKNISEILHSGIKDVYTLLENLLVWAQSQTGSLSFSPRFFDMCELIMRNISLLKSGADKKQISIEHNCREQIRVFADYNMIETVIRNLMTNALKFTPEGGKITARSHTHESGELVLCISDTGVGIPQDVLPELFSPGRKHTTAGTSKEKGSGIGLMLCKEFIDLHKGKIEVESELNKGSTFCITLPPNTG